MPSKAFVKPPPGVDLDPVILRIGEIFLKGKNRRSFFGKLLKNARRLLADLDGVIIEAMHLRVVVWHPPSLRRQVLSRLERLFGLSSFSPATSVRADLEAFATAAVTMAKTFPSGSTFKVNTNRRDKQFPGTSMSISRELGGRVLAETDLRVDVHKPDHTINIEIGLERSFIYSEQIPGAGGLPIGSSGTLALLLSGGIDSPVAGYMGMRRGCPLIAIYYHSFPYTGDKTKEKVLALGRHLARWHGPLPVHVVHFTEVQKQLREHGRGELAVLLYRRMMVRAGCLIAKKARAKALLTGENLGQVASQTLENLAVIEEASDLPILRPLIAFDKTDIIDQAIRIGTYETSILPHQDACSLFVPKYPATRARLEDLYSSEEGLDVHAMAESLANNCERIVCEP